MKKGREAGGLKRSDCHGAGARGEKEGVMKWNEIEDVRERIMRGMSGRI